MATIKKRIGKTGKVTYHFRCYAGYSVDGRQIEKTMTWTPPPECATDHQQDKAAKREAARFEERVLSGLELSGNIRFAEFAAKWMEDYGSKQLAPKTRERYESMLVRINQGIGNIRLDKLKPHHLMEFYNNLGEPGVRSGEGTAMSKTDFAAFLQDRKMTRAELAKLAGVAPVTVSVITKGGRVSEKSATAVATVFDMPLDQLFTIYPNAEPLSDKTILHHHRLISSILQTAVEWQIIYDNPASRVKPPKVARKEAECLQDTEAVQVLDALEEEPIKWKAAVVLLMYSGIRRGELFGLEWKDIDFENELLYVRRTSQYVKGMGIIEKDTKNESSERVMKLDPEVFTVLREYQAWQNEEITKLGDRWCAKIPVKQADGSIVVKENARLFTQVEGMPMNPDSLTDWINGFCERHSLRHFSPHTLRHTNVSLLIAAGVPIRNVSQRAGHSSMATTMKIYSHAIQSHDAMAAGAISLMLHRSDQMSSDDK